MKLSDIKIALIEQFFTANSRGVKGEALDKILIVLGKSISVNLSESKLQNIVANSNQSNDPSKAFKKFTEGDSSLLTIADDEGTVFAAIRTGKTIKIANLTTDPITEKMSDFLSVKHALKQSKLIDEDINFFITTDFANLA